MRIISINIDEEWEQNYKREEFIDKIINQILMICKFDKNFDTNGLNGIDEEINKLTHKIKNKDILISKSNQIKKSIIEKISILENENNKIRLELLESLGAEL